MTGYQISLTNISLSLKHGIDSVTEWQCPLGAQSTEGSSYETCQASLLYVFAGCFGGLPCTKTWKNSKGGYVFPYLLIEALYLDCVIHEQSMSIKQKKIGQGPSSIYVNQFFCYFVVYLAVLTIPSINYAWSNLVLSTELIM